MNQEKSLFPYNKKLANEIGNWAYVPRFPDKYPTSVSAYASLDADAYCRGGGGLTLLLFFLL